VNKLTPIIVDRERKLSGSGNSKTNDITSITDSTKIPGNGLNGRQEFKVIDSLLINTFVKLSSFSDILGRKMVFEVDWDYLER